ncbi:hypothetical protein INT43_007357 [Umbelopsis isabellina]|uniref:SET domain-containing protein n=1 Tax=Mortierella isabellina TaxID=91625 RepID=A0A8H7PXY9_MORIS|nr:hypothetical protein INT43_007357 [Umbelopsis isabellina]
MSNILRANNSDTGNQNGVKGTQEVISLKSTTLNSQISLPSTSSLSEVRITASMAPDTNSLPTDAEAAVLITHLSAGIEAKSGSVSSTLVDSQASDLPLTEENESRTRSKSHRSTPSSGNGSDQETEGSFAAHKRVKRPNPFARLSTQPRWHNQSYMLFLALRQHPDRCLPRTELIKAALAMDKKISDELNLPKVFRGKTPMNSASAILTNNSDRYFIPYKPPGSRSTHFKLAYEPCNFQHAVEEYRIWEKKLVDHDWPYCFGVPIPREAMPAAEAADTMQEAESQDSAEAIGNVIEPETCSNSGVNTADLKTFLSATAILNGDTSGKSDAPVSGIRDTDIETERRRSSDSSDHSHKRIATGDTVSSDHATNGSPPVKKQKVEELTEFDRFITRRKLSSSESPTSALAASKIEADDPPLLTLSPTSVKSEVSSPPRSIGSNGLLKPNSAVSTLPSASEGKETGLNTTLPSDDPTHVDLSDLDLSNVPKTWKDIVEVKPSNIPNSGNGLFAIRDLPYNTPLGFYFGVPMTEDEFDSLKDNVGMASQYSIMYRKTVLDATDTNGMPYIDPQGEMYCPFHFMNENEEKNSNITFLEGALVNQVICWTKRDIKKGEELFVWYGRDVDRHWEDAVSNDTKRVAAAAAAPCDIHHSF